MTERIFNSNAIKERNTGTIKKLFNSDEFVDKYLNEHKKSGSGSTAPCMQMSSEVRFYTVEDLCKALGWSRNVVQRMFNMPDFPAVDYGKCKVVEAHALISFFSVRREKNSDGFNRKGDVINEQ